MKNSWRGVIIRWRNAWREWSRMKNSRESECGCVCVCVCEMYWSLERSSWVICWVQNQFCTA
jgi:hypothetical protein